MSTNLTHDEFSKHVGTQFKIAMAESELSLMLTEAKAYTPGEDEQDGMERFSVFFTGRVTSYFPSRPTTSNTTRWVRLIFFLCRSAATGMAFGTRRSLITTGDRSQVSGARQQTLDRD